MKLNRLYPIIVLSLPVIIGALAMHQSIMNLAENDEPLPAYSLPHVKRFIREQRMRRHTLAIEKCTTHECLSTKIPLLIKAIDIPTGLGSASSVKLSDRAINLVRSYVLSLKYQCDQLTHLGSLDCYKDRVDYLNAIPLLSPDLVPTIDKINKRIVRLREIETKNEEERVQEKVKAEERARIAEVQAQKERDYAKKYLDFTWKDSDTGARSGKAIVERERIRKYRSIGNNDMAQGFLKMYDEWGSIVLNPNTGHEFHEIRVNCDIYESSPDVIESGSRRYGMTGDVPKGICSAAGYPRR